MFYVLRISFINDKFKHSPHYSSLFISAIGSSRYPRNITLGRGLKEVACGGQHTLFLLQDGSVYTCGSNSCGQLGEKVSFPFKHQPPYQKSFRLSCG
uniref:Uncharacterized protein n=1 Tax=Oryzias latipes TaxID=8090 RepID=A0A3P9JNF2_ORYLA